MSRRARDVCDTVVTLIWSRPTEYNMLNLPALLYTVRSYRGGLQRSELHRNKLQLTLNTTLLRKYYITKQADLFS